MNTPAGPSVRLARYASSLRFEEIPGAAVARMKLCVLDSVGCALLGSTLPWCDVLGSYVVDQGGKSRATVWGRGDKVPAAAAVLVNGTLIHSFELDDLHKASILHPSSVVVPAALAMAETAGGISGRAFLAACIAGFEVGTRVGMSVGTSHLVAGHHPTGTNGTVAAAAAAGHVLGLEARQMEHAISIGATQAAGLMAAQYESMVKRMHAGRAAQAGIYGAELASRGFTGIDDVFEREYGGYCSTLSGAPDLGALTQGLGEVFETERVGFKTYSCCGSCHTSVEAAKRILSKHRISPRDIKRVEVLTTRATLLHVGWPYTPRGSTSAQMNLPYCLAVTLLDGDAFVDQFMPERTVAPDVVALAERVEVKSDESFDALGPEGRHKVRVAVHMTDGQCLEQTVDHAKGSSHDPMSHEEVVDKFHRLVEPIRGAQWADEAHHHIMSLDVTPDAASLAAMLSRSVEKSRTRSIV